MCCTVTGSVHRVKKWTKKKIIISVLVAMLVVYVVDAFYVPYKEVEIEYLGSVSGDYRDEFFLEPDVWTGYRIDEYAYNRYMGYYTCEGGLVLSMFEMDFTSDIDKDKQYVVSYDYPIKFLQYTKEYEGYGDEGYYNRAKMDVENYQEGVWFIYQMEDIHLRNMFYDVEGIER